MCGATGNPGDVVVLEGGEELGLPDADGAVVALLAVLVITPGVYLREGGKRNREKRQGNEEEGNIES